MTSGTLPPVQRDAMQGIIPPLVTPFRADGSIDEHALRAEVRYLLDVAHVHGITICRSTGEGHTLTTEECCRIAGIAIDEARGRVPVIAGIITNSTQSAIERALALSALGVDALQVTPVHYLFRPDDDAMIRHFAAIGNAAGFP
jgi:4-hydroxy-tetrahydrodipicolinate synthase